jgi:hypothetical protein
MSTTGTSGPVTAPCTDCGRILRTNPDGFWPFIAEDGSTICDGQSGSTPWGHRLDRDLAEELMRNR